MVPSGSSVAGTNPGAWGSRVGGVECVGRVAACGAGEVGGVGEADCAAAEAANVSKTIQDARFRACRNVDSFGSL